ncbi:MAG: bacterioferritin [Oligoflexales bacterium]|nr:bacterioferritin [Oligoflexales bacterium]
MQSDPKVIEALNEILMGELTAINQYFLHSRMCKNWGYNKMAATVYAQSIDEMKHASEVTDRILFLDGIPNMQKLGKLNVGENIKEQLESDLQLELHALTVLRTGIDSCYKASDHVSRELMERILKDEEEHADWLKSQLQILKDIGIQNFLARQID